MIDKYPKFLPQWTKAMEHYYRENRPSKDTCGPINFAQREYGLDWYSINCCFTGEAFFHDTSSVCKKCSNFTYSCGRVFGSLTKLYRYKKELAEHLQKDHSDIWDKWKNKL